MVKILRMVVLTDGVVLLVVAGVLALVRSLGPSTAMWIGFISDRTGDFVMYQVTFDGTDERRLTTKVLGEWTPDRSPDGRWRAFVSYRRGNVDIYRVRADGSNLTRVTTHPANEFGPIWSPPVDLTWHARGLLTLALGLVAGVGWLPRGRRRFQPAAPQVSTLRYRIFRRASPAKMSRK
jgi:hypothetical protein